jgi:hypothetical protein
VRPIPQAGYYDASEELVPYLTKEFDVLEKSQLPVTAQVIIIQCKITGACLGQQKCLDGMTGPLCDACVKGWYKRSHSSTCIECPDFFPNVYNIGIVAGGVLFLSYFLVKRVSAAIDSRPIHAILVKLAFSYFLLTSAAFRACDVTLPDEVNLLMFGNHITYFLKGTSVEETPQQDIMSMDCMFSWLHEMFTEEYFESYRQFRLGMALTLPIQVCVAIIGLQFFAYVGKKCLICLKGCASKSEDDEESKGASSLLSGFAKLIPYLLMIYFFLHPLLAQEYFQGFLCIPLSAEYPDAIFYEYDISQSCSADGQKYRLAALGGLGWWGIGFPIVLMLYLRGRIFDLYDHSLCTTLGLLYNGYEEDFYYWEVIVFIRKIAVLGCFIVPMRSQLSKISDLLCVGMISLGLHEYAKPYDNRCYWLLDRLETKMLWAFVFTTVLGLYLRIRKLYPMPEGGWPKDWTDPVYIEDQVIKYAVVVSHLRFVFHFLFFIAYEFFLKSNPCTAPCFADGRMQYDPALKEFDISKLNSKERQFLAATFVECVKAHVEDLKWFTFRYIEAAWKEAMFEILHVKAVQKKAFEELFGKAGNKDDHSHSPHNDDKKKKKNPVLRICGALKKLICGAKKKKPGDASARDPDEDNIEVDWSDRISLEKIQLHMLRHVQFPVDTFRKDLARGKAKSNLLPIDMIDPKTGLSQRCINIKTRAEKKAEDREKRSVKNQIKQLLDTPEKRAARAKAEEEREFYETLFGGNVAEWSEKKKKPEKQEKKGVWKAAEWLKPTIPEGEASVAGVGGPRSVKTLDYITSMVASFDRRHGGPEFVLPPELNPRSGLEEENLPKAVTQAEEQEVVEEPGMEDPLLVDPNAPVDAGAGVGLADEQPEPAEEAPAEPAQTPAPNEPPKEGTSGAGDPLAIPETPAEGKSGAGDPLQIPEAPAEEPGAAEAPAPDAAAAEPAAGDAPAAAETEATTAKEGEAGAGDGEPPPPAEGTDGEAAAAPPLPTPAIEVPAEAEPAKS